MLFTLFEATSVLKQITKNLTINSIWKILYQITLLPKGIHTGTKHKFYFYIETCKRFKYFIFRYPIKTLYFNISTYSTYNSRSENEHSGSKLVEDINK
jgi:hypothetical protein